MYPIQMDRDLKWGLAVLLGRSLPLSRLHPRATDSSDHRTRVSVVAPYIQRAFRAISRRSVRLWTFTRVTVRLSWWISYPRRWPSHANRVWSILAGKVIRSTFRVFVATNLLSVTIYYHIPGYMSTPFSKKIEKFLDPIGDPGRLNLAGAKKPPLAVVSAV